MQIKHISSVITQLQGWKHIVNILHSADFLASKVEYDMHVGLQGYKQGGVKKTQSTTGKRVTASAGLKNTLKNL